MITTVKPEHFKPVFAVASCFVEREDGKILLLLRPAHKSEGGKWGVPAGKVEKNERPSDAVVRELYEETGISLGRPPTFFEKYYVQFPDYDFVYHVFHQTVENDVQITLSDQEHERYEWVTPTEALALNLVKHQDDCTKFFYFSNA